MTVASIVPFDTEALRTWGELHGQPPLDRRELEPRLPRAPKVGTGRATRSRKGARNLGKDIT